MHAHTPTRSYTHILIHTYIHTPHTGGAGSSSQLVPQPSSGGMGLGAEKPCVWARHFEAALGRVAPSVSRKDQRCYDALRNRLRSSRGRCAGCACVCCVCVCTFLWVYVPQNYQRCYDALCDRLASSRGRWAGCVCVCCVCTCLWVYVSQKYQRCYDALRNRLASSRGRWAGFVCVCVLYVHVSMCACVCAGLRMRYKCGYCA